MLNIRDTEYIVKLNRWSLQECLIPHFLPFLFQRIKRNFLHNLDPLKRLEFWGWILISNFGTYLEPDWNDSIPDWNINVKTLVRYIKNPLFLTMRREKTRITKTFSLKGILRDVRYYCLVANGTLRGYHRGATSNI